MNMNLSIPTLGFFDYKYQRWLIGRASGTFTQHHQASTQVYVEGVPPQPSEHLSLDYCSCEFIYYPKNTKYQ